MTVKDLMDRLVNLDPDTEVRLMTQERWPFENTIRGVCDGADLDEDDDEDAALLADAVVRPVVYIVEGRQLGYGNRNAWSLAS